MTEILGENMRKIYVDVSMIMVGTNFTGIPRVVMEVTKRLHHNPELEFIFLEYDQNGDDFRIIDTDAFVRFCETKGSDRKGLRTKEHMALDACEAGAVFFDMDTVWKTRVRRSFLYPRLKSHGVELVVFMQDIIGVTHPQFCPTDDMLMFLDFVGAALAHADKIVVTSLATKHAIDKLCGELFVQTKDISIVPLGGNFTKGTRNGITSERLQKIIGAGKFLLMVGTVEPRKNHKLLLDAYDAGLKDLGMNLVIAGYPGWNMEKFFERLVSHKDYGSRIFYINGALDQEISDLYTNCFALAYPSYIEGYGLPIMEAFMRNVPVIAADTPINMEIGGEYAVYFEQDRPQKLTEKVKELLDNETNYLQMKERLLEFVPPTWEQTADGLLEILTQQK